MRDELLRKPSFCTTQLLVVQLELAASRSSRDERTNVPPVRSDIKVSITRLLRKSGVLRNCALGLLAPASSSHRASGDGNLTHRSQAHLECGNRSLYPRCIIVDPHPRKVKAPCFYRPTPSRAGMPQLPLKATLHTQTLIHARSEPLAFTRYRLVLKAFLSFYMKSHCGS